GAGRRPRARDGAARDCGLGERFARRFLQEGDRLAVREVRSSQLAERLVARQDEQQRKRAALAHPQATGAPEVADEPLHLASAVGALAIDEVVRGWIDRGDSIELAQDRALRRPEP